MAEARLGVDPTPGLQRAGYEVDTSYKRMQANMSRAGLVLYIPAPRYMFRNAKKSLKRAVNKLSVAFMPAPLVLVCGAAVGTVAAVLASPRGSWLRNGIVATTLWKIDSHNPLARMMPKWYREAYLAAGSAITGLYSFAAAQRFVLRGMLRYHGWLDRKKHTKWTKVWGATMKFVFLRRLSKQLYAYQYCLPTLPLPSLQHTCARYVETVRPLMTEEELAEHTKLMSQFLAEEGPALQRRLWAKWLISRNYVSDWWLKLVYLRSRDSLCINSNWYGISFADYAPTTSQSTRAAVFTYLMVHNSRMLDTECFEPQVIGGVAPVCMAQYEYAFRTTRVPGIEQDTLEKFDSSDSRHVAVFHKGRLYKLPVFSPNSMGQLSPLQLKAAFEGILESKRDAPEGEMLLPALTSMNRTEWAKLRVQYLTQSRHNRTRLAAIEEALFVVVLDDENPGKRGDWGKEGKQYMCGNGHNRWSDKSFNLIITPDGRAGVHAEHSWGDAPALAHLLEICMLSEKKREFYTMDGDVLEIDADRAKKAKGHWESYPAERLDFRLPDELVAVARQANADYVKRIDNFDLYVNAFTDYGKKFVSKVAKCSPDAWIQMALQLAYFRDQHTFTQTYESSMTRLYAEGRTETIRSASTESVAFCRAMEDKKTDRAEVLELLRIACDRHQQTTYETMVGEGVDRHLFALYVVSVGKDMPSPFLQAALRRKWSLSTSQVPPKQLGDEAHKAAGDVEVYSPLGGFGPVADDGYGVCYNIWDDRFYFNVSSSVAAKNTDAKKFHKRICQALQDLRKLVPEQ